MRRIGLFGGTFNPVHTGHLQVARELYEGLNLDKMIIIPSAIPPHKEVSNVADAADRLAMARLAFSDLPGFEISDTEIIRTGPSYSIDTVKHYKSQLPAESGLYLIMGVDAFLEINTWKSFMDLFMLTPLVIMTRPGRWHSGPSSLQEQVELFLRANISDGYTYSDRHSGYVHADKQPVILFNVTPIETTATQIRAHIKNGRPIHSLVPTEVEEFIYNKGLYR